MIRTLRDQVETLFQNDEIMFTTTIRHAKTPAVDARELGLLVHELDRTTVATLTAKLPTRVRRFAESSTGLAGDHQRLAGEIAERITARVAADS